MVVYASFDAFAQSVRARIGVMVGVDHGNQRIGLARCLPNSHLAMPWQTVSSRVDAVMDALATLDAPPTAQNPQDAQNARDAQDTQHADSLASLSYIRGIVIGLPRHMSGEEGQQAHRVRSFAGELSARMKNVPVVLFDERFSSLHVERLHAEVAQQHQAARPRALSFKATSRKNSPNPRETWESRESTRPSDHYVAATLLQAVIDRLLHNTPSHAATDVSS